MNVQDFINLCDSLPLDKDDEHGEARTKLDVCTKEMKEHTDSMAYAEVIKLRTSLIYLSILDESVDYQPYYDILDKICSHFNDSMASVASWSSGMWEYAISYAKQLPEYPKTDAFVNEELHWRERERARAAKRLEALGVTVGVNDGDLEFNNLDAAIREIHDYAKRLGGRKIIDLLVAMLPFNNQIGRFVLPRNGNSPMQQMVEPEMPFGYIYNLGLKYIEIDCNTKDINDYWEKLKEISTDYCLAVYNSQKYDIWQDLAKGGNRIVSLMHELVIRFDLYNLPQTNVSFVLNWCRFVIKETSRDERCSNELKDMLACYLKAMSWWSTVADANSSIVTKLPARFCKECLPIEKYLSLEINEVNMDFFFATDMLKVNYMMYPLYKNDDKYILLPRSLGAWNWYEALSRLIKAYNIVLEKNIGQLMEEFIRKRMRTHGITPVTGEYRYDTVEGEVDFLIESSLADVIIESKKKSLTRNALKGDDYYIWGDLYEVIYSQMQCFKLENGVKNHGPVDLSLPNGRNHTYTWNATCHVNENGTEADKERYIVKATMTLKEYGPLNDKVLFVRALESLAGKVIHSSLTTPSAQYSQRDIDLINECFGNINEALAKITTYQRSINDRHPFFFCRFLSMEQVYFLINESKDNDSFAEKIRGSYLTVGTQDFWNEYLLTNQQK